MEFDRLIGHEGTEKVAGPFCGNGTESQNVLAEARRVLSGGTSDMVASCTDGKGHETFLSFPQTSIVAGATTSVSITVRANLFQGQRLWFGDSCSTAFVVTSVKIGNREILDIDATNSGFIPAELFSSRSETCPQIPFCPAPVSQVITLTVKNISLADTALLAGVQGVAQ